MAAHQRCPPSDVPIVGLTTKVALITASYTRKELIPYFSGPVSNIYLYSVNVFIIYTSIK